MKKKEFFSLVPLIIITLLLFSCTANSKILSIDDITSSFYENDLYLKPQMSDGYPVLYGIKPNVYEILDYSLFIYLYDRESDIQFATNDLYSTTFVSEPDVYIIKNTIILYFSDNENNELNEKIKKVIKLIEQIN